MSDYQARIVAEFQLLEATLSMLQRTVSRPVLEEPDWMAAAGYIFNFYGGIENVLKTLCRARGVALPRESPSFHRDLLDTALQHGILDCALRDSLDEYRAFRHFFVHGYGIMLDPRQVSPLVEQLPDVWHRFRSRIHALLAE